MKGYYKIRELAEAAPFTTISSEGRLFSQRDMIAFAESIVRECANHTVDLGRGDVGGALLDHFGVKE